MYIKYKVDFWYHICLDVDTVSGTVDTAINGKLVSQGVAMGEGMMERRPKKLMGKLVVGKWKSPSGQTFPRSTTRFL